MVNISNILYGNFEMPMVIDSLLKSRAVQRLQGIHQSGGIFLVNPRASHTRLDHSIGVMLLIKKLGGSEIEQIAGLLHDIAHTAFSHVGDYVMEDLTESYHEKVYAEILLKSDIPNVLHQYGYRTQEIIDGNFEILEQPSPNLCADRIDYTLRDALQYGLINREDAIHFIRYLSVKNNKIILEDESQAIWINQLSKKVNQEIYNHPEYVYANTQLAKIIKRGLAKGVLSHEDLFLNDILLLNKIRSTYEGVTSIKAIKTLEGFKNFLREKTEIKIKKRYIEVPFS